MKPIALDDFCRLKFLSGITFSPAGKSACFVVSAADKEKNAYTSCLYLRKDGKIYPLTSGGKERSFCYLDEDTVLFQSNREDSKEPSLASYYYKISLSGGEAQLAYKRPDAQQRDRRRHRRICS